MLQKILVYYFNKLVQDKVILLGNLEAVIPGVEGHLVEGLSQAN